MQEQKLHKITPPRRTIKSRRRRFYFNRHLFFSFQFLKLKRSLGLLFILCGLLVLSNFIKIPLLTSLMENTRNTITPLVEKAKHPFTHFLSRVQSWQYAWQNPDAIQAIKEENAQLRFALKSMTIKAKNEKEENIFMQSAPSIPHAGVAKVIGYPGAPFVKNALITFITSYTYPEKSSLLHPEGLVGFLQKSGKNYGYVTLITNVNAKIPAITGSTHQHGIVTGHGPHLPTLEFADSQKLKEGEPIYTSGGGGIFPNNILIGHLKFEGGEPKVIPAAPLHNLKYLYIVPPVRDLSEPHHTDQQSPTS